MNVASAGLGRPANEAIPATEVTRRGGPGQAGQRPTVGRDQIFEVLTNRLRVTQVMVLLDQTVKQRFLACPSNLFKA